jgi:hypothetical protein
MRHAQTRSAPKRNASSLDVLLCAIRSFRPSSSSSGLTRRSSSHRPRVDRDHRGYWIPACAGMTTKHACVLLTAARIRVRLMLFPVPPRGGWRAEKSKPMAPYCRQTRRAPLGAPIAAVPTPGLAFPARGRIELRLKLGQPAPGGTSYWVREELRCRPGACCASAGPQAPLVLGERAYMAASISLASLGFPYSRAPGGLNRGT